jgi:hypothetical protein
MPFDRFFIGPLQTGLQQNLRPFLINDDAFEQLQNAYVFRGRVRKRFGERLMGTGWDSAVTEPLFSRLRINLGNTDGSGNKSVTVPGAIFKVGQMFSVGDEIFTVVVTGTPGVMLTTGASTVHTYDTTTGAVVINGAAATTPLYFYPGEPVMGLCNYENGPINNQPSYGFDTQFAYLFTGGAWQRSGTVLLNGTNLNFVETANYRGTIPGGPPSLFISNYHVVNPNGAADATDDYIWYTQDGSTWVNTRGAPFYFAPTGMTATGPFIVTSRLIVSFKNRLLLLSTIEQSAGGTNTAYTNRCRYSWNGSPFATNAWYEPNTTDGTLNGAGAGFIDATTEEQIISAEFIKDRLIVYFERSTWELAYTGNYVIPFLWQKINTELGSEAQFSTVPFDKVILTMGTTGVHACSGSNVERIDTKIPDQVFNIQNRNLGVQRVYGIRDYFTELVYWTFPATDEEAESGASVYPTQILIYNYRNDSWAINTDCITAFGYFEQQNGDNSITWASTTLTWQEADMPWQSGTLDANFRQVIAGNQQGYTFICDADESRNARAMQITNMTQSGSNVIITCIDHTLSPVNSTDPTDGDYVILENFQGATLTSVPASLYPNNIFPVYALGTDKENQFVIPSVTLTGTYTGGGTVSRVSNISIASKQWNPYLAEGRNVFLQRIDFGLEKTANGEVTVDYFPSATDLSMLNAGGSLGTGANMGTGVLETRAYDPIYYPLEQVQNRIWHPLYFQSTGECIQILMYMNPTQITTLAIAFSDFELDSLILHTNKSSDRLQ